MGGTEKDSLTDIRKMTEERIGRQNEVSRDRWINAFTSLARTWSLGV